MTRPTTDRKRIHIGLAVSDLERSRSFYETLLGTAPTKLRPGYVKFEPADPSLNLTLNAVESGRAAAGLPTHYGIQVDSAEAVRNAVDRFRAAGLTTIVEEDTTCCYAVQDKAWVEDPDGNRWEVFVVTQADAEVRKDESSTCCATTAATESCC